MLKINIVKGFDDFVLSANVNITHVVGAGWAVDAHCEALGHCCTSPTMSILTQMRLKQV